MEHLLPSKPADAQSLDVIASLLSDRRRRHAVAALAEREPPFPLGDLAAAVASREAGSNDGSPAGTAEIAVALHHVHLPALDEAGVVDYDAATNVVGAVRTEPLAPFLEEA